MMFQYRVIREKMLRFKRVNNIIINKIVIKILIIFYKVNINDNIISLMILIIYILFSDFFVKVYIII